MESADALAGLNAEQRAAAEAVRGRVCIIAGAGSGKTKTITHRIAHQVATETFRPGEILAVTFTDKAAAEMRSRLSALGVAGVAARTFHSAALAVLRALAPEPPANVLPSKIVALRPIANRLPGAYRFRPAADLAAEIERAKNLRISPDAYQASLRDRKPPIPPDLMERVYRSYEHWKLERGLLDFEDMLELAGRLLEEDEHARTRFRARFRAFTVDEYQDVNLLQQRLLELWLGDRDDLCVVGDDYQSIYGFTGATPRYLLAAAERDGCRVVRLESNYRSTPQVLALANRLVPQLRGAPKTLRAVRGDGTDPVARAFGARSEETAFVVERIRQLHVDGVAFDEVAVLYRTNARSEEYEEALAGAKIPYRVRAGAFLARAAARRLLPELRRSPSTDVAAEVRRLALAQGWLPEPEEGLGEYELARQQDLGRFVRLAEELDDGARTVAEFVAVLEQRHADGGDESGVNLLTYHRAKGLEFDAVFLPRLEAKELPSRLARADHEVAGERRLLYVGITRAKRHLFVTWAGKRSAFLDELGLHVPRPAAEPKLDEAELPPVYRALKAWRLSRARLDGVPAYVVFHDRTLAAIATRRPLTASELAGVSGVGPAKLERYGSEVLRTIATAPN